MSATWLPAVTAVGGTVVGLVVGEMRARRTDRREDGEFYRDRRRAAYEQLWKLTEEALVAARVREDLDAAEHLDLMREVNAFSLQHAVYIDAVDRQLASDYLESVLVFLTALASHQDSPRYRRMTQITTEFPPDFGQTVRELGSEFDAMRDRGTALRTRVRTELGAPARVVDGP